MAGQGGYGDRWIRRLRPEADSGRAGVRLVCFPFAGGAAGYFRSLAGLLGPEIDAVGVQYPGRQDRLREPAIDDIGQLADRVHEALTPWSDRPMVFLGHSMGAVVAFEVARRMAPRGPLALFASARRAPSVPRAETVHLRDDAGLVAELRALGGAPAEVLADDELMRALLPAVRADYRAIETYRPPVRGAVLDVPVTALVGDRDPVVSVADAEAWQRHTSADFTLRVFRGGHFYLRDAAGHVAELVTRPAVADG